MNIKKSIGMLKLITMLNQRIKKLREILREKNLDGFLVSNFYNILYLSGFRTLTENEREAWVLITAKNSYLFSDSRYLSTDPDLRQDDEMVKKLITPEKNLIKHLQEIFLEEKIKICAVEADDLKLLEFQQLIRNFRETKFTPTEKIIIKQREIKDIDEVEKIKKACEITDLCLKETLRLIKVGRTEKEIAFKIEFWLKEKGYDLAFYPIVAVDENSAIIHYDTRAGNNKKIGKNSIILIDFGAKYQDYLSDMTRVVFVGKQNDEVINIYNALLHAQTKTVENSRAGIKIKEIDSYCRQLLSNHQSPVTNHHSYPHSTGHGVGLEIHEYPKISPVSEEKLMTNQIITIEPGVYIDGKWGMRVEDTVLVKDNQGQPLTKFNKDLLII